MENINWLGNAGFFFDDLNGKRVYFIDPIELGDRNVGKADILFLTHAHPDHFSLKDIEKLLKGDTVIVATQDLIDRIPNNNEKIIVSPNNSYTVNGFSFQTVPAYNINPARLEFHPKANNWVGYIFDLNGMKIYHAGDTDFIPEMNTFKDLNLDIAMLPIGGHYTMDWEEAADAANTIAAKKTIPMHYKMQLGERAKEAENNFKDKVTNSDVVIMEEFK